MSVDISWRQLYTGCGDTTNGFKINNYVLSMGNIQYLKIITLSLILSIVITNSIRVQAHPIDKDFTLHALGDSPKNYGLPPS